jgi:hypothetical protein
MLSVSRTLILYGAVVIALLVALPGALVQIFHTRDPYLFTQYFFRDISARLSGPGRLRFIVQPMVAIFLGLRRGIKDAQEGRLPLLWALAFQREHRRQMFRSAVVSICDLIAVAILLDIISQFLIFHNVRPGAALLVGPLLITLPYALSRALTNRLARSKDHLAPMAHRR